jgi:DNA-binding GntR family transcriptional regulator
MGRKGTTEHGQLVKAIEQRDVEAAMKVMKTHLQRTASRVESIDE